MPRLRSASASPALRKPLQKELSKVEKELAQKNEELRKLSDRLADGDFYTSTDPDEVARVLREHGELKPSSRSSKCAGSNSPRKSRPSADVLRAAPFLQGRPANGRPFFIRPRPTDAKGMRIGSPHASRALFC